MIWRLLQASRSSTTAIPGFIEASGAGDFSSYAYSIYYEGDFHYSAKGTGDKYVDWQFTDLRPDRAYQIAATWRTLAYMSSNAKYEVYAGINPVAGVDVPLMTVEVDQRVNPDDFADGANWEELTTVSGQTALTIRLSNDADNRVYADAIRLEQLYLPEVTVSIDGVPVKTGSGLDFGALLAGTSASNSIEVSNSGVLPLVVSNPVLPVESGLAFTVIGFGDGRFDAGESFTIDVAVDADAGGLSAGAHSWNITFDTNDLSEPSYAIPIDVDVVEHLIVDDGDPGFRLGPGSNFAYLSRSTEYVGNDVHYHARGTASDVNTVEWEFAGLTPGSYNILSTWYGHSNRATDAPYTVYDGSGTLQVAVDVNQEPHPDPNNPVGGVTTSDGTPWQVIFTSVSVADEGDGTGTLVVELSDQANDYVIADAIMVQYVSPLLAADSASPSNGVRR